MKTMSTSDVELAEAVRNAATALNTAIRAARKESLRVEVRTIDHHIRSIEEDPDEPQHLVHVKILRRI